MRVLRRSMRRGARAQEPSVAARISKSLPWRAPIVAGLLAALALALLNGDLRVSPAAWATRLLVALAQVGLLAAFFHSTGLLRPTGLALRSPIAHSTRSVGLALACLVALLSLIGVRAASLVGHGATLSPELGFLGFAPLIAGGMLLSVLIHPLLALYVFAVLLMGVAVARELPALTLGVVGLAGWGAILAIAPMRRRTDMFWAGALLSALLVAGAFGASLGASAAWMDALSSGLWGVATGVGAVALFWDKI